MMCVHFLSFTDFTVYHSPNVTFFSLLKIISVLLLDDITSNLGGCLFEQGSVKCPRFGFGFMTRFQVRTSGGSPLSEGRGSHASCVCVTRLSRGGPSHRACRQCACRASWWDMMNLTGSRHTLAYVRISHRV